MGDVSWRLVTADEAYEVLGYRTPKALREAAFNGLVPCVRIGRRVRFDLEALRDKWAANGGTPQIAQNSEAQRSEQSLAATI